MPAKNSAFKRDRPDDIDIVKVMLVKDTNSSYRERPIQNSKQLVSIAKNFLAGQDREVFIVFNLDESRKINSIHVVAVGSASAAVIHPREVFKTAILSNASSVILVHNHPSGSPVPSDNDEEITCELFGIGDFLRIKVLDHIIIGDSEYSRCEVFEEKDGKKKIYWETKNFEDEKGAN